jgi:hypothetical protein
MPQRNVNRLRRLAVEAWTVAGEMTDPGCRRAMERLAALYEGLADHVEQRRATSSRGGASPETRRLPLP